MPPADRNDIEEERVSRWCVTDEERPIPPDSYLSPNGALTVATNAVSPPPYPCSVQRVVHPEGPVHHFVDSDSPGCGYDDKFGAGDDEVKGGELYMWVLDPHSRKLRVPLSLMVPTHATANKGALPSLCLSFLEGHCRHEWCRQAHVPPHVLPMLRQQALNAPTCCRLHKDPHSTTELTDRFKFIRLVGNEGSYSSRGTNGEQSDLIPAERVALTVGLQLIIAQSAQAAKEKEEQSQSLGETNQGAANGAKVERKDVLDVPAKDVCRLHISRLCRYVEDCKNIHICREYDLQLPPPPNLVCLLNGITPSMTMINIGERSYSSTMLSLGEVTDEVFNIICDQQRRSVMNNTPAARMTPASQPYQHANQVVSCANPGVDAAINSASPLSLGDANLYTAPRGGTSPASCGMGDATPFAPASQRSLGQNGSPNLGAAAAGSSNVTRVLRIFDVRPKSAGEGGRERGSTHRGHNTNGNGSAGASPFLNGRGSESASRSRNGASVSYNNYTCPNSKNGSGNGCAAGAGVPPCGINGSDRNACSGSHRRGSRHLTGQSNNSGRGSAKRRQKA